jgi:hypothetical protein
MIEKIFRPTWFNILDEDSKILFNREEFLCAMKKLTDSFDLVDTLVEPLPPMKISDATGFLFTLHIDYSKDIGLVNDEVGPIEQRFPYVAYRAKLVDPDIEWHNMPPMEYFDVCYMPVANFSDKRLLHDALEKRLTKDFHSQL